MFNVHRPVYTDCVNHSGTKPYKGFSSFIYSVKWNDFIFNPKKYIDIAINIRANINEYDIVKTIK